MAEWLRQQRHDVVESLERGQDPGDRVLLAWAAAEARVLVTMDKDFGEFVYRDRAPHSGLVRRPDVPVERRIALMNDILRDHAEDLLGRAIVTVRGGRLRISREVSG